MKKWKELGEVPDSEDEGCDISNSDDDQGHGDEHVHRALETELPALPIQILDANDGADIWDIPISSPLSSPQSSPSLSPTTESSRKTLRQNGLNVKASVSSLAAQPGQGDISPNDEACHQEVSPGVPLMVGNETPLLEVDEISTSYVTITTPPPAISGSVKRAAARDPLEDFGDFEHTPLEYTSPRLQRSLRPRKPIQQHPYLLESAQYTRFMKSHGIKPVKVSLETEAPRRPDEEDSQNQEFETGESQDMSGPPPTEDIAESPPLLFDDALDDRDVLALSLTPPKRVVLGNHPQTSSQQKASDFTDATSIPSDEEFPSLDRLMRKPSRLQPTRQSLLQLPRGAKRQRSAIPALPAASEACLSTRSSSFDIPSPLYQIPESPKLSPDLGNTLAAPRPSQAFSSSSPASPAGVTAQEPETTMIDLTHCDENGSEGSNDSESVLSNIESDSDSEVVRQNGRRIRGVLPASWLRLDQAKNRTSATKTRRSPEESTDRAPGRGVAIPRQWNPKPSTTLPSIFYEDDDSDTLRSQHSLEQQHADERSSMSDDPFALPLGSDDGLSAIEEDHIDKMVHRKRRNGSSTQTLRPRKKQKKLHQSTLIASSRVKHRQLRIDRALGRAEIANGEASRGQSLSDISHRRGVRWQDKTRMRNYTPPELSILDIAEPTDPPFVRIAARTAKRRRNLGRASPSKKLISFATRQDNIDALSTLRDWIAGRTRPRQTIVTAERATVLERRPLQELSSNMVRREPSSRHASRSQREPLARSKVARQVTMDDFAITGATEINDHRKTAPKGKKLTRKIVQSRTSAFRPAQLEESVEEESFSRRGFVARKRTLDALYRERHKESPESTIVSTKQGEDEILPTAEGSDDATELRLGSRTANGRDPANSIGANSQSRFRKKFTPRYIDLEAPRFAHANDPLPVEFAANVEPREQGHENKLQGLGPYGTQYTQHFEIFPLDRGVFFHESTIIGRGYLSKAVEASYPEKVRLQRPSASFELDQQTLRWGIWEDVTSSELGILVDWIAEQLISDPVHPNDQKALDASRFVLEYILGSLSFRTDDDIKAFVSRSIEVFQCFNTRIESGSYTAAFSNATKRTYAEVLACICVAILAIYRLSRLVGGICPQSFQVEDLLKRSARLLIRNLLGLGLADLRALYGELQQDLARECGIRSSHVIANGWVIAIRVLENASIPGSSFWDITQSLMASPDVVSGSDAQIFEGLWHNLFTLLPLCEIDNSGVLVSGLRNLSPVDCWALPQKLLKRVFELYQKNPRQSPSFNEYCRALVARCHYLIQQWGWRKYSGIIGTIFDFFGSQSLSHLRNEDAYSSPKFLEEIGNEASLLVGPEDRCFHIFIKIVALAIRQLRQRGYVNDIKNLVARILPNHSRQYLKEDTIHQRELAALRNHHDLLCTLIWASPPVTRPPVHLIEKLIVPGSSHKEACLINIRAWSQLAKFIISSDEGSVAFQPLVSWCNHVFQDILNQYLSAASDIEQQFQALSKEAQGTSFQTRDAMISKNKRSAMDILHFCMKASLGVLKVARSLGTAIYTLNIFQLQSIFSGLDFKSPGFDWSIVHVGLDTVENFVDRIEKASEAEYSSDYSGVVDPQLIEEAVLLLDARVLSGFFSMGREALQLSTIASLRGMSEQGRCVEKTIILSARIAAVLKKMRVKQLSVYFSPGTCRLFAEMPTNLGSTSRKLFPLFLAILVKNHVFDFKELGMSLLGLWMLCIIKPVRFLGHENYLAEALKHSGLSFLRETFVPVGLTPDYNSNHDFFAGCMHYMRDSLRSAEPAQTRQLRDEYAKILQLTMQKMKEDLKALVSGPSEHKPYVEFVRQIISLIKSYGVGICTVDFFYTQPSVEYAPPPQDSQLHTAGIIAYGIKLGEKDANAGSPLFYYLCANFKTALLNDKLHDECMILEKAICNPHILSFMVQRMLPAIIKATTQASNAWLFLDIYVDALGNSLTRSCMPKEVGEDDVKHVVFLLQYILNWFTMRRDRDDVALSSQELHIIGRLMKLANSFQSILTAHSYTVKELIVPGVTEVVDSMASFKDGALSYLGRVLEPLTYETSLEAEAARSLFGGLSPASSSTVRTDPLIDSFANYIVSDVARSLVVTPESVTVQTGGITARGLSTQSANGTRYAPWHVGELWKEIHGQCEEWCLGGKTSKGRKGMGIIKSRSRGFDGLIL